MGPRPGLDGCGKSRHHSNSIPDCRETIDARIMLMYKLIIYEYEDIFVGNYCNDVGVPGRMLSRYSEDVD